MISAEFPFEKKFQAVNRKRIAYVEAGEGDPSSCSTGTRLRPTSGAT